LGVTKIKATDWTASNARLGMPRPRATNATRDTRVEMQINVISMSRYRTEIGDAFELLHAKDLC